MTPGTKQSFAFPPELLLSREIERYTGTQLEPAALKRMIADHWQRLSVLAHAIHEAAESERPKAQGNQQGIIDAAEALPLPPHLRKQTEPWPPTPWSAA